MSNNMGGNRPTPLQFGRCDAWINADYTNNITGTQPANNTAISSWANLAGINFTYAQGTGANQPVFKSNVDAGKGGILFDGVNDVILGSGSPTAAYLRYASNTPFSMLFTFRMLALTSGGMCLEAMRGAVATDKTTVGVDASSNLYWEVNSAGVITTIATPFTDTASPHIVFVSSTGVNVLTMYLDGVQITGGTASSTTSGTANTIAIGNIPGLTRPWNGYIYDHCHFSSIINDATRDACTRFFANLRGIAI